MTTSIRARLTTAFILMVALPVGIIALNFAHAWRTAGDAVKIDYAGSERMRSFMTASLAAEYLRKPTPEVREKIITEIAKWDRIWRGLLDGDSDLGLKRTGDAAIRTELDQAGRLFSVYKTSIQRILDGGIPNDVAARDARANEILSDAFGLYDRMERVTNGFQEQSESGVQAFRHAQVVLAGAIGIIALFALLGGHRYVLRPLPSLLSAMRAIGRGDLRTRVPEEGPSEFLDAARAFNAMGAALEATRTTLVEHERELARKNDELEHASRLKSEFLANMSHELRTPLNAVLGYAALLRRGTYGPLNAEQREALDGIVETGKHLLDLINDVLDLSKIEAGMMTVKMESTDLRALVDEVARAVEPLARNKGLAFRHSIELNDWLVDSDAEKVRRIILNFLSNAFKFTKSGSVELRATESPSGGEFILSVRDTGVGIPPEDLPHIFENFRQGDGSPSREFGGTGLGLSISLRLARLIGAQIDVETAVGAGSSFSLLLPKDPQPGTGGKVKFYEYARN